MVRLLPPPYLFLLLFLSSCYFILLVLTHSKRFETAVQKLQETLQRQRSVRESGEGHGDDDAHLFGITLHNIAVVTTLKGRYQELIDFFQNAVDANKTSFGNDHRLVAVSRLFYDFLRVKSPLCFDPLCTGCVLVVTLMHICDRCHRYAFMNQESLNELGLLCFAQGHFNKALAAFEDARNLRIGIFGPDHPKVAMTINNIACIYFLTDQPELALAMFKRGKDILRRAMGLSMAMVKLDLLHVAMVSCNLGYMESRLKNYDEVSQVTHVNMLMLMNILRCWNAVHCTTTLYTGSSFVTLQ